MIIDIQNLSKAFDSGSVLENISFHIEAGEKCALIGANGCGKTTLLRLLAQEIRPDLGEIYRSSGCRIGYLPQIHEIHSSMTLYEYIREAKREVLDMEVKLREMEHLMKQAEGDQLDALMRNYASLSHSFELKNGFAAESEIRGVINGLGFTDRDPERIISDMSGGEKTRAALGRLLLDDYDLLMLDEPTNHLDLKSVEWLENYLSSARCAMLIVSHDRFFLDRLVSHVFEIENGGIVSYSGNYTVFSEKKAKVREARIRAWMNQQKEIRHQEAVIEKLRSFNREKSIKRAESRVKALAKIERLEKPVELKNEMHLTFTPSILSGNDVLSVSGIRKAYGRHLLFSDLDLNVYRGEKVALIGANGTGKTTILKILNGLVSADSGSFRYGSNVYPGYYDQEQQILDPENTIFEEISDTYPDLSNTEIRNVCAGFLFMGDDVFKQTGCLSGGEKARLSLAKLMLSETNFLILDEPTNHLDIVSREILEDAIRHYGGTVIYVSHDRYFINRTASRILELENGVLTEYKGNYDYYLEKKAERSTVISSSEERPAAGASAAAADWQDYKKEQARARKHANDLKRTEDAIQEKEDRLGTIDEQISRPEVASDPVKLTELCSERARIEEELDGLYLLWEELSV